MDLSFSDDQNLLRDSERFVQKDTRSRTAASPRPNSAGCRALAKFAELGWLGMPFSEADGGLGGTPIETMIVIEELGKGLVLEPFMPSVVLAGGILRRAGARRRSKRCCRGLIGGETFASPTLERGSRFDLVRRRDHGHQGRRRLRAVRQEGRGL